MQHVGWGFVLIKIEEIAKQLKVKTIGAKDEPTWDDKFKKQMIRMIGIHYEGVDRAIQSGDYRAALTIGTDLMACLVLLSFC